MARLGFSGMGCLLSLFLFVSPGYPKAPAPDTNNGLRQPSDSSPATNAAPGADDSTDAVRSPGTAEVTSDPATVPAAQKPASGIGDRTDDVPPAPRFTPMLATTGTVGLFTVETGDTLPKHGFLFSGFGNKFGRMPGSVTILETGLNFSYGVTDDLNFYAGFDPYGHVHVGCPGQLSLRSIPLAACVPENF